MVFVWELAQLLCSLSEAWSIKSAELRGLFGGLQWHAEYICEIKPTFEEVKSNLIEEIFAFKDNKKKKKQKHELSSWAVNPTH